MAWGRRSECTLSISFFVVAEMKFNLASLRVRTSMVLSNVSVQG